MASSAKSLDIGNLDFYEDAFLLDVVVGLASTPKTLSPKYLYDEKGSRLFQEITKLKEYYPTRCDLEIMQTHANKIRSTLGLGGIRILELGVGDGEKTKVLIGELLRGGAVEYIPIDISHAMVVEVMHEFEQEFKGSPLMVTGIASDYVSALRWLRHQAEMKTLVLFLGSSIGNFEVEKVHPFLLEVWNALSQGDWALIGFDLKKDLAVLQAAYDDSKGITKEFNLNLLDRINREFNADFKRDTFEHYAFYNPSHGRMESWLVSKIAQTVHLNKIEKEFHFTPWEGIHMESSYKYSHDQICDFAKKAGFEPTECFYDSKNYFVEALWQKI